MKKTMGMPKGPAPARARGVKPGLKVRHLKMGGASAFPQAPTAFGPQDPAAGPPMAGPVPGAAAPGDTGQ